MTSGQLKRPAWPEYPYREPKWKNLCHSEGKGMYDAAGRKLGTFDDFSDFISFLDSHLGCCYVDSLVSQKIFPYLDDAVRSGGAKIICNREGSPQLIRVRTRKSLIWVVCYDSWGISEGTPDILGDFAELFSYVGVGYAPTPSSLGRKLMVKIHQDNNMPRHTALSLSAEHFVSEHSVGGVVHTPGSGNFYNELLYMDMSSAYLSQYSLHPAGTAGWFVGDRFAEMYATYFARCIVQVRKELALGPFPVVNRKSKGRIIYPTLEGMYESYLWKEQVEDCRAAGCDVQVCEGYGWPEFTTDNLQWAQKAFWLRKNAPTEFIEKAIKKSAVAAIGRHKSPREHYFLVPEERADFGDIPVFSEWGDPYNLFVHAEQDPHSAFMYHWWSYTVMMCNHTVYNFALPYAQQGRLVMVDYDSIMVLEKDETHRYVKKYSVEAMSCPPGTWLWMLLHNVNIHNARRFESDELVKMPGGNNGSRNISRPFELSNG